MRYKWRIREENNVVTRLWIRRQALRSLGIHVSMASALLLCVFLPGSVETRIPLVEGILISYLAFVKRFDYLDPLVGYLLPWLLILLFSTTRISRFAISIHRPTYTLVIVSLVCALFVAGGKGTAASAKRHWIKPSPSRLDPRAVFLAIDIFFISFTIFNVMAAGYLPLLRGMSTGDTGYLDFGIHGVFGFYLAMANALAILYLVIFLRTGKRVYLIRYFGIVILFVLLVTRQNIISVAVESAVAYSLIRRRIKWRTILASLALGGAMFSLMGNFRSGSIREIAGIETKYSWVPDSVVWLYAYSYFNIANIDNLVSLSDAPYYNASSISQLIPSSLRPSYDTGVYLLLINFNVSSYMFPVYEDAGRTGVFALTILALWLTERKYRLINQPTSIRQVGIYCVLYFCASFSFFFNFWFYLPVIFQVAFFMMFGNISELACVPIGRSRRRRFVFARRPHVTEGGEVPQTAWISAP